MIDDLIGQNKWLVNFEQLLEFKINDESKNTDELIYRHIKEHCVDDKFIEENTIHINKNAIITAIKKEIPLQIETDDGIKARCPNCKNELYNFFDNYCSCCGQKLKE